MTLDEIENGDSIDSAAQAVSLALGLSKNFVHQLRDVDDDWSFVIKCHALMESALTLLLSEAFGRPEIRKVLAGVDTSQKLDMCSQMSLFDKAQRGTMRYLSKLRNKLVHNVDQVEFSFSTHLANKDVAKAFADSYTGVWVDPLRIGDKTVDARQFSLENAKLTVWFDILYIVGEVHLYVRRLEFERYKTKESQGLLERYEALMGALEKLTGREGHLEWVPPSVAALLHANTPPSVI